SVLPTTTRQFRNCRSTFVWINAIKICANRWRNGGRIALLHRHSLLAVVVGNDAGAAIHWNFTGWRRGCFRNDGVQRCFSLLALKTCRRSLATVIEQLDESFFGCLTQPFLRT